LFKIGNAMMNGECTCEDWVDPNLGPSKQSPQLIIDWFVTYFLEMNNLFS
jgi:hypothetical protein